jgi:deazaflavin-dependent oxidoreductase (nitroreductase family)
MRALYRFPILLYRLRLGWILGHRFLLLEHHGRKSAKLRYAVIEVVDHDRDEGSYVVAAAWGTQSDWFKNISKAPRVYITVSAARFLSTSERITAQEAERHLRTYSIRNPFTFKKIGSLLIGQGAHATEEIIRAFVDSIPFVKFSPIREDNNRISSDAV